MRGLGGFYELVRLLPGKPTLLGWLAWRHVDMGNIGQPAFLAGMIQRGAQGGQFVAYGIV